MLSEREVSELIAIRDRVRHMTVAHPESITLPEMGDISMIINLIRHLIRLARPDRPADDPDPVAGPTTSAGSRKTVSAPTQRWSDRGMD